MNKKVWHLRRIFCKDHDYTTKPEPRYAGRPRLQVVCRKCGQTKRWFR